jgi:integrase
VFYLTDQGYVVIVVVTQPKTTMAALRKKPHSKFWYACFTLPDGKRVQRSTKETKRKDAQDKADSWEKLSRERAKARQAHRVISDIYRAAHNKQLPDSTARAFFTGWLARRKGEISPATYAAYSGRSLHFLAWLEEFAERPIAELETSHITRYRDAVATTLTASTANHGVKVLRVILEDARRDGYLAENPAKDCSLLKKASGTSRRPFTVDELRLVLAAANTEWRSLILFGIYTGLRLGDLARLTWANLDLTSKEIHLATGKTGRVVRIPIAAPLMDLIETLPAGDNPKAPIHPEAQSLVSVNVSTLSRQFGELLASVGLIEAREHTAKKDGKGRAARRGKSELSFHSLRHTSTSLMKNAGISPAIVQDIIGHDSAEMSAHYTHVEHDAKRNALATLPNFFTPNPQPETPKS